MATKNIDSISVFLETVDEGVRSAKLLNGASAPSRPAAAGVRPRALGLGEAARSVLAALEATSEGEAPADELQRELGLGWLELGRAVSELEERHLVEVEDEVLRLVTPDPRP